MSPLLRPPEACRADCSSVPSSSPAVTAFVPLSLQAIPIPAKALWPGSSSAVSGGTSGFLEVQRCCLSFQRRGELGWPVPRTLLAGPAQALSTLHPRKPPGLSKGSRQPLRPESQHFPSVFFNLLLPCLQSLIQLCANIFFLSVAGGFWWVFLFLFSSPPALSEAARCTNKLPRGG